MGGLIRKRRGTLPKSGAAFSLQPHREEMAVFSKISGKADSGDYTHRGLKEGSGGTPNFPSF